jgi:hypothetical protein
MIPSPSQIVSAGVTEILLNRSVNTEVPPAGFARLWSAGYLQR